jgi:putative inorganic carbon (HCO3(-)) transporter
MSIVLLAVLAVAVAAALYWPLLGLLVYVWLDFMRPHDMFVELRSVRPMLVIAAATVVATVWRERQHALQNWRALLPVAALAAVVAASIAVSVDRARSLFVFIEILKMLAFVWLLDRLVHDEWRMRAVLWTVVLSLGVLAVVAIIDACALGVFREFHAGQTIQGPAGRGDGGFRDNNDLARVLALSVPLWWALAALPGARWSRCAAAAGALLGIGGIESAFSRGGFLALLAGAAGVATSYRPFWRGAALWLGFVVALLVCSPRTYIERLATIVHPAADTSIMSRVGVWEEAAALGAARPLLGQGAGTFRLAADGTHPVRRAAHSFAVEIAVELGVLGLLAYGWLLLDTLWRLHRLRGDAEPWVSSAAVGIQSALLAVVTASLTLSGPFLSPLFILIGLSIALQRCTAMPAAVVNDVAALPSAGAP